MVVPLMWVVIATGRGTSGNLSVANSGNYTQFGMTDGIILPYLLRRPPNDDAATTPEIC